MNEKGHTIAKNIIIKMNKIVIFIQARISSRRLPGKVLKHIDNYSILEILINRLKKLSLPIYVLTSEEEDDKKILDHLKSINQTNIICGDLLNVRERFMKAINLVNCDYFFRVTADNPFTSISLMNSILSVLRLNNYGFDYLTNNKKYILEGIKAELVSSLSLKKDIDLNPKDKFSIEHVTWNIARKNKNIKIIDDLIFEDLDNKIAKKLLQKTMTIDTNEEYLCIKSYFESLPLIDKRSLLSGDVDIEEIVKKDPYKAMACLALRKDFI